MDIYNVVIPERVLKSLQKLPKHIALKLQAWVDGVGEEGLLAMRRIPGYHDEPLHGKRTGQRSIRLSKAYRAIYRIDSEENLHFVEIIEVNKHDY